MYKFEEILGRIKKGKIQLISFDIFNTLLLRKVRFPIQVFEYMFQKHPEYFPKGINRYDWRNIRIRAEHIANGTEGSKKYVQKEIKVEDIYAIIPSEFGDKKKLIDLEIESECDLCIINDEIYQLIRQLKASGLRIILTSDMYLERCMIEKILVSCGVDIKIFDDIFVSCEHGYSKKNGELYDIIIEKYGISGENIFHIGDDEYSDVGVARTRNICVYHYDFIPRTEFLPFAAAETFFYPNKTYDLLYIYRTMAYKNVTNNDSDYEKWYKIGFSIVAPFCTMAIEWVLDVAKEEKIWKIRPLMREGEFLCKLLKQAIEFRNEEYDIQPLYISRLAVFTACFGHVTEKDILYLLCTQGILVRDVFDVLNITELENKYDEYLDVPMANTVNILVGEDTLFNNLFDFLKSPETTSVIKKNNCKNENIIKRYLSDMGLSEDSLTLDLGWRGYIQNAIDRVLGCGNRIHLLFVSREGAEINVLNGSDIRGFVGNYGRDMEEINANFDRLLELFFMSREGTTVGYFMDKNGEIKPKIREVYYPETQKKAIQELQRGVLDFQRNYLESGKRVIGDDYKLGCFRLLERLFSYPCRAEAKLLAKLKYDQNFGTQNFDMIIPDKLYMAENNFRSFYSRFRTHLVVWYPGINVINDPAFYLKLYFLNNREYLKLTFVFLIEDAIHKAKDKKIVVVGAGKNARLIIKLASIMGKQNMIAGFIDNDMVKHGTLINGIKVTSFDYEYNCDVYLCSIEGKADSEMLHNQIETSINRKVDFFAFHSFNNKWVENSRII